MFYEAPYNYIDNEIRCTFATTKIFIQFSNYFDFSQAPGVFLNIKYVKDVPVAYKYDNFRNSINNFPLYLQASICRCTLPRTCGISILQLEHVLGILFCRRK